jgi:DUF4097 and DUF4098 domain-containing protein YvlB
MDKTFPTTGPASLYVELGSGTVDVHTAETAETRVSVHGHGVEDVTVEQRGDQIVVIAPPRRGSIFGFASDVTVRVTMPHGSDLVTKLGSADLVATGRYGAGRVRSGSGDVHVDELSDAAVVQTGSGDISITSCHGHLRVKSGSGAVHLGRAAGSTAVVSGSGRITVDGTEDELVAKSGSGDIRVGDARTDVSLSSGSGDLQVESIRRGVLKAKAASGDIAVGVPPGIPVWTDVSCVSGSVQTNLEGAGQPEDGQDYIEIRATTVSGDIHLNQI